MPANELINNEMKNGPNNEACILYMYIANIKVFGGGFFVCLFLKHKQTNQKTQSLKGIGDVIENNAKLIQPFSGCTLDSDSIFPV